MQGTLAQAAVGAQSTKPSLGWQIDPTGTENKNAHTQYQKEVNLATYGAMYYSSLYGPRICVTH